MSMIVGIIRLYKKEREKVLCVGEFDYAVMYPAEVYESYVII